MPLSWLVIGGCALVLFAVGTAAEKIRADIKTVRQDLREIQKQLERIETEVDRLG